MEGFSKTWVIETKEQFDKLTNRFSGILFSRVKDGKYLVRTYQSQYVQMIEEAL